MCVALFVGLVLTAFKKTIETMTESNSSEDEMSRLEDRDTIAEILHTRIKTKEYGKDTLEVAEQEIETVCDELEVSEGAINVAQAIYRRSLDLDVIQNRTVAQLSTAAIMAACRIESEPYSIEEVSAESAAAKRYVGRTFSEISRELELNTGVTDPTKFVPRFCSNLGLNKDVEEKAIEILDVVIEEGLASGKSPSGCAAASIYAACLLENDKRSQREVARECNVSARTISDLWLEQIEEFGEIED